MFEAKFEALDEEVFQQYLGSRCSRKDGNYGTEHLQELAELLCIEQSRTDARSSIVLDYYATLLDEAAISWLLPYEKVLSVARVARKLFDIVTSVESREEVLATIATIARDVCGPNPSSTDGQLSLDETAVLLKYLNSTIVEHHRLYYLVFRTDRSHDQRRETLTVETPNICSSAGMVDDETQKQREEAVRAQAIAAERAKQEAAEQRQREAAAAEAAAKEAAYQKAAQAKMEAKPASLESQIEQLVMKQLEEARIQLTEEHATRMATLQAAVDEAVAKQAQQ